MSTDNSPEQVAILKTQISKLTERIDTLEKEIKEVRRLAKTYTPPVRYK